MQLGPGMFLKFSSRIFFLTLSFVEQLCSVDMVDVDILLCLKGILKYNSEFTSFANYAKMSGIYFRKLLFWFLKKVYLNYKKYIVLTTGMYFL
jgi:hypothetical protein